MSREILVSEDSLIDLIRSLVPTEKRLRLRLQHVLQDVDVQVSRQAHISLSSSSWTNSFAAPAIEHRLSAFKHIQAQPDSRSLVSMLSNMMPPQTKAPIKNPSSLPRHLLRSQRHPRRPPLKPSASRPNSRASLSKYAQTSTPSSTSAPRYPSVESPTKAYYGIHRSSTEFPAVICSRPVTPARAHPRSVTICLPQTYFQSAASCGRVSKSAMRSRS